MPVWQVQEGLVRVSGFKHRKLAQMACRGILMFAALLWQDVGKAFSPPAVERTGMRWMSSTYVVTMKSKPGCQSARRLDLARPCVQMTEEAGRESERGKACQSPWLTDFTSKEQVCSVACLASRPLADIWCYFRALQPWTSASNTVTV